MRLTAACLSLAVALAATGARAADGGLMGAFKAICLDTGGDAVKGGAAAQRLGWRAADLTPAEVAGGLRRFVMVDGEQRGELLMENADKPADRGIPLPTRRTACAISLIPDATEANAALRAYLGVDPSNHDGPKWWWSYVERGAGRDYIALTPQTLSVQALEALGRGPWVVLAAGPREGGQFMMFSRIVKTGP